MATITRDSETVELTPKEVAQSLWSMDSEKQADMLEELIKLTGGSHLLMMQFLMVREECESRGEFSDSLECFQSMFASAFKYMW